MRHKTLSPKSIQNGCVRISTTVRKADWEYVQKKNLAWADLLRASIRDHKVHTNEPDAEVTHREIFTKLERVVKHRKELLERIKKKLGEEEYINFLTEE